MKVWNGYRQGSGQIIQLVLETPERLGGFKRLLNKPHGVMSPGRLDEIEGPPIAAVLVHVPLVSFERWDQLQNPSFDLVRTGTDQLVADMSRDAAGVVYQVDGLSKNRTVDMLVDVSGLGAVPGIRPKVRVVDVTGTIRFDRDEAAFDLEAQSQR